MKKPKIIYQKKYKYAWGKASRRYAKRHLTAGLCRYCPTPTKINPHTGKNNLRCPYHLTKLAARQKLRMRKLRAMLQKQSNANKDTA
jgi:hypothetical protein